MLISIGNENSSIFDNYDRDPIKNIPILEKKPSVHLVIFLDFINKFVCCVIRLTEASVKRTFSEMSIR